KNTGSANQAENDYHWNAHADQNGFIVAYPDGVNHSWNAGGGCCGSAVQDNTDDIGFLTELIETISRTEPVDPARIYVAGVSNGAAMAYRYACEGKYRLAAIGSVSGSFAQACSRPHPTSVMAIHGLSDLRIPFEGGFSKQGVQTTQWTPIEKTMEIFRAANKCRASVSRQSGPIKTITSDCSLGRKVTLVTLANSGHIWPGEKEPQNMQDTAFDATQALWSFFEKQAARPD
ncbi:MAG: hypothetical protein K2Q01_04055, partial [Rickettsiales bacterium]|nr:hypothetical protein [Rickettsiales bacterium]